jgi:hypothetical protein
MDDFHSRVARVGLAALARYGFALAGGYAVQVHGIVERPSEDVDLFTDQPESDKFRKAASEAVAAWRSDGLEVSPDQQPDTFARFYVSDGRQRIKAELSYDWRSEPPVVLDIGPVLSRDDSVANKVCAAFSRGEARDYIDIHAAVSGGLYTRTELEKLAVIHDAGFNLPMFAQALRASSRHSDVEYTVYGLSLDQVKELRSALFSWADDIESR